MQSEIALADGPTDHMYQFISDALQAREDCGALRELNTLRKIVRYTLIVFFCMPYH